MKLYDYFSDIATRLKISREGGFVPVRVSDRKNLEGALTANRDARAFYCIDDSGDGVTFQGQNGGYFTKQIVSVFIMKQYDTSDASLSHMAEQLSACRQIAQRTISHVVHSESECKMPFVYVNKKEIAHYDLPIPFITGYAGVHLVITFDIPIDIHYNADEWATI